MEILGIVEVDKTTDTWWDESAGIGSIVDAASDFTLDEVGGDTEQDGFSVNARHHIKQTERVITGEAGSRGSNWSRSGMQADGGYQTQTLGWQPTDIVNEALNAVYEDTNQVRMADTLCLPVEQMNLIATKPIGDNANRSTLAYIRENIIGKV